MAWTENIENQQKAWVYLTLALEKTPVSLIQSVTNEKSYTAWTILRNWYKPTDTDAYIRLSRDFKTSILHDPINNPRPWILELINLNAKIGAINAHYRSTDKQMIAHILNKLLIDCYGLFMTMYQVHGYNNITLETL